MPPSWDNYTDGELLRAAAGFPDAFSALYERYESVVLGYLMRQTRNPELSADLTAETFATALLKARKFRDDGNPAAGWLLGIARHALLTTWARQRTEQTARRKLGVDAISLTDASLERVEASVDAAAPDNLVLRVLWELPESQRDAVRGHVLEERSYADLADQLGVPAATVRQRVSRGLARMRTALEGRYP